MASVIQPRQPFAALDSSRLQALGSVKNRQNAISAQANVTSPSKGQLNAPLKRRLSPEPFDSDLDTENIDPNILFSPSKKGKAVDGTPVKSSKFNLIDAAPKHTATPKYSPLEGIGSASTGAAKPKPKSLSLTVPNTTNSTPIAHSRGSPKHKRIGLLSSTKRRSSSSPFRRAEAPAPGSSTPTLPFSIDAALSGTLSSYKAKHADAENKAMPKSWFFDIHIDSPEEEAANMMEHSASILDISSDDDCTERRRKLEAEKGKENVPPADYTGPTRAARSAEPVVHKGIGDAGKKVAKLAAASERMEEDRAALADLEAADFYPEGLDELSVELVEEKVVLKGSGLSKETFDFEVEGPPSPSKELEEAVAVKGDVAVLADEL